MGGDRVGPATSFRWRRFAAPGGLVVWTVLGVCLVFARQVEYGVGLEFDSANYISAARNLLSGSKGEPLLLRHDGGFLPDMRRCIRCCSRLPVSVCSTRWTLPGR